MSIELGSKVRVSEQAYAKRDAASFPLGHKVTRLIWAIVWLLFASWTPPQMKGWRNALLRLFGANIHSSANVHGSAKIWYPRNLKMEAHSILAGGVQCYNMALITLEEGAIVSQRAFLCGGTHDYSRASKPLITREIVIGAHSWVAAEAYVAPGTVVGEGCVVGARAAVTGVLKNWSVYAGNPAELIKSRRFEADM